MKNIVLFFLLISVTSVFSQKDTIWFDKEWSVKEKDSSVYYRIATLKEERFKEFFPFMDYDTLHVKLKEGITLEKEKNTFQGEVVYYNKDTSISERVIYKNGFRYGTHKTYYKSGKLKSTKSYIFGVLKGPCRIYFEEGNLYEMGAYLDNKREGIWKVYYKNNKLKEQGMYKAGQKTGVWKVFYYNGTAQD